MKRVSVFTLFAAIVLLSIASAVPAVADSYVSLGIYNEGGASLTYGYGEFALTPGIALGLAYYSDQSIEINVWQGATGGVFGELALSGGQQLFQFGGWKGFDISPTAGIIGWAGVQTDLTNFWVKAAAEAEFALSGPVSLFAGASTTLLKQGGDSTATWFGVGYYF